MELEEAIKQCMKFIKSFKEDDTKSVIGFDVKAIETVLQALEQKDKRIYYLENMAKADITHEIDKHKFEIYKNYIPKGKIEDKIETFSEENEVITQEEYYARNYIRKFLKELLEE